MKSILNKNMRLVALFILGFVLNTQAQVGDQLETTKHRLSVGFNVLTPIGGLPKIQENSG
ncbi:MAG: hypothetical protein HRT57_16200, partial [Crocinitomicaceae bacterium]|nr:hypothetical protein [Crocinitomicaceae bacterium]